MSRRAAVLALLLPGFSHAYVRQVTDDGHTPLYWRSGCVFLTPDARGSEDVALDVVTATIAGHVAACDSRHHDRIVACDFINLVKWHEDAWGTTLDGVFVP